MRIYLIRHGETRANTEKKYLGMGASPFTELGLEQNQNAFLKLMELEIDAIFSSPSARCLSPAQSLGRKKQIEVISDNRLHEIDFGKFEGLTWQSAKEKHPKEFELLCQSPNEFTFPCGESQNELDERAAGFIDFVVDSQHKNVAVFSHGGTIMSMISSLLKLNPEQKWRFKIKHGSISTIEISSGYASIIL